MSLRALVQSVLEQTFTDMQKQIQVTNAAFQLIVKEIKSAKSQMEDKLAKVGQMSILKEIELNEERQSLAGEGKCDKKCAIKLGVARDHPFIKDGQTFLLESWILMDHTGADTNTVLMWFKCCLRWLSILPGNNEYKDNSSF